MGLAQRRRRTLIAECKRRSARTACGYAIVQAFGRARLQRSGDPLCGEPVCARPSAPNRKSRSRQAQALPWWPYALFESLLARRPDSGCESLLWRDARMNDFGCADMLGPDAEADKPGRKAAQKRKAREQLNEPWRRWSRSIGDNVANDMILDQELKPLGHAGGKLAPVLHAL